MTFLTRQLGVRTIQFVRRITIVVKEQLLPRAGCVAFFAAGDLFVTKLPAMHIPMTVLTGGPQRSIPHEGFTFGGFRFVAFAASNLLMAALERKIRQVMIESCLTPALETMTPIASCRRQSRRELPAMNIVMASLAALIFKNKTRHTGSVPLHRQTIETERGKPVAPLSRMASNARRCQMTACQSELCLCMLSYGKCRRSKALDRMTSFACSPVCAVGKLAGVRIGVAVSAKLMGQRFLEIAAGVAFVT